MDEEPQELHDALVRSLQDQEQEPKGILELVLDEEDERYRKEVGFIQEIFYSYVLYMNTDFSPL